jgi:putative glutamine amidotransferase
MRRPWIGLTADFADDFAKLKRPYLDMVAAAGGVPMILPPQAELREAMLERLDGVIVTGGPDIDVSQWSVPLHPQAECMPHERQQAEFALLDALASRPEIPVLGICLGMQLMGVHRGNPLIQHLADVLPNADRHRNGGEHMIAAIKDSPLTSGRVRSWHHQALGAAEGFEVIAHSDDGVIEGIADPQRNFYVGVQWHPERTPWEETGLGVLQRLIAAARR